MASLTSEECRMMLLVTLATWLAPPQRARLAQIRLDLQTQPQALCDLQQTPQRRFLRPASPKSGLSSLHPTKYASDIYALESYFGREKNYISFLMLAILENLLKYDMKGMNLNGKSITYQKLKVI